MNSETIYLDHAATTPVHPDALAAMLPCFGYHYGNPNSLYNLGKKARILVEESRARVAALINADPSEIIFTSGGTEADNLAIKGFAFAHADKGRHIITCATEHHAVMNTCEKLEDHGFRISYLPVDSSGTVSLESMKKAISNDTILITVMHANNETGTIHPIMEIGNIAYEHGIAFHTDAVQSAGKIPIDTVSLNADLLSISSHKIYGPKGVGALYVKKGTAISPELSGGGQEKSLRSGTENVAGIVGFGRACEAAMKDMGANLMHVKALRDFMEQLLLERFPGTRINGHPSNRLPHILSISFEGLEAESIVASLDAHGICASAGAACTSGAIEPSHVLASMCVPPEMLYGTVRLSPGWENTEDQIIDAVEALEETVNELRDFSKKGIAERSYLAFSETAQACTARKLIRNEGTDCIFSALPASLRNYQTSNTSVVLSSADCRTAIRALSASNLKPAAVYNIRGVSRPERSPGHADKERLFWDEISKSEISKS